VAEELKVSQGVVRRARDRLRGARRGRPPILTADEEAMIVKKLKYYAERGAPMTQVQLRPAVAAYVNSDVSMERRELIHQTFVNGRPRRKWLSLLIGRHPEVTKVYGRSLSAARAAATNPENLARMCALMKQVREEKDITSENVFNADECGVDPKKLMSSRRQRCLAGTGKSVEVLVPTVASNATTLTFLPIVSADGRKLPTSFVVIGKAVRVRRRRLAGQGGQAVAAGGRSDAAGTALAGDSSSSDSDEVDDTEAGTAARASGAPRPWQFLNDLAPPKSLFRYRKPAGMDRALFTEWALFASENVFRDLRLSQAKLLILNGCKVHLSYEALEALSTVKVEVFMLPANTKHVTQQLDVAMFKPFKHDLREELATLVNSVDLSNNRGWSLSVWDLVACITKAEEKTFTPSTIKMAFEQTCVEPWGPNKFKKKAQVSDSSTRRRKRTVSLGRLAARLAPSVSCERHELVWQRGTLKTTQAVFMDEQNRNALKDHEEQKRKAEDANEQRRVAREEAKVTRAAEEERKAKARADREAATAAKKVADEKRKVEAAALRAAKKAAAAEKMEQDEQRKKAAAEERAAARAAAAAVKAAAARERKEQQAAKKAARDTAPAGGRRGRRDPLKRDRSDTSGHPSPPKKSARSQPRATAPDKGS